MRGIYWLLIGVVVVALVWQTAREREMKFVDIGGKVGLGTSAKVRAAGFSGGGEWINSDGFELDELLAREDTRAVLVDFWTYSCINCQRTLPYLRSWWDKYKDKGLVIVGVHTPEFEFEKDYENVAAAVQKYQVDWPVVQDNDYGIWKAYSNRYWPRKYLVNKQGEIVYDHIGEGGYEETEGEIQKLLGAELLEVTKKLEERGVGFGLGQTPELYVNKRGQESGHLGKGRNKVELAGEWRVGEDFSEAGKDARLVLDYSAGEVNLVMSEDDEGVKKVEVKVDGERVGETDVGEDDLYKLWRGEFGRHRLEMEFEEGVRVHAFTFGR